MSKRRIFCRPEDFEPDRGRCPQLAGSFEQRHGISRAEVQAYQRQHGVTGVVAMYDRQRRAAWDRGVAWEMNLRDWIEVWGDKISRRGQGKEALMMCRLRDEGPYKKGNVRIATSHENATDRAVKRRIANWGPKHGGMPTGY